MYEIRALLAAMLIWLASAEVAHAAPKPVVDRDFVIVLDPGHGGTNRGCQGHGGATVEKAYTLKLALALREEIVRVLPHATVVLTRERDETLTLAERVRAANDAGADLFISLHANASDTRTQQGFETYILDVEASSLEAAATAMRENQDPSAPSAATAVERMLRELSLTTHRTEAAALAAAIQREQATRFPGRVNRGVKQAPFDVLMGASMPAVLFEVGFLDHPQEGPTLLSPVVLASVVDGLATAIAEHHNEVARRR